MPEDMNTKVVAGKVKLEVAPDLSIDVDLTADHLVDLKVSMTEEALLAKEEVLIKDIKSIDAELKRLEKEASDICEKTEKAREKKLGAVIQTLAKAGMGKISAHCRLTISSRVPLSVEMETTLANSGGHLCVSKRVKAPTELTRINSEEDKLKKEKAELAANLTKIKADLANVPRMERSARATLAMRALETTPAGKQLLDRLNLPKLLPGPKT